jgi:peptidoglycan hydrolase-like protein with peptidoglycan-binding domain
MPPFDRRRSVQGRTASGRTGPAVFTSDDLDRDLTALMQDPLYWRERDRDFADHVTRQFQRVHGPDGPTPDGDGKRRGTLEVPRLRRRPGDDRLKQPVGRDAPNRPDDVTRLQRALSETGDYTFTAPRERSGVMSANLETAVTRYQRRTGLKPDGYVAPDGPTVQQIAAQADENIENAPSTSGKRFADGLENELKETETSNDAADDDTPNAAKQNECSRLAKLIDVEKYNISSYKQRLKEAQRKIEVIDEEIKHLTSSREAIIEMGADAYAAALAARLGITGIVVFIIYKARKQINFKATIDRLRSARQDQEAVMNQSRREIEEHRSFLEEARNGYSEKCEPTT